MTRDQAVSDFFSSDKQSRASLDIETSGLVEGKDKIWSLGISKGAREEEFFIDIGKKGQDELMSDGKKIFDIEGYFDPYKKAIKDGDTVSPSVGLGRTLESVVSNDMLLIQNHHFENIMIGAEITDEQADKYGKQIEGGASNKDKRKILNRPKAVEESLVGIRADVNSLSAKNLSTENSTKLVDKINKGYENVLSEYGKSSSTKGAVTVVDLMDITKATYAKAASKHLIDISKMEVGTSIDFLSKIFLGQNESHTAAADATTQMKIFDKLGNLYQDMDNDVVSTDTSDILGRIKVAQVEETGRLFLSSMRNTLEEIHTRGSTKIITHGQTREVSDGKGGTKKVSSYAGSFKTSDPSAAVNAVAKRFSARHGIGNINMSAMEEILRPDNLSKMISKAKELESGASHRVDNAINGIENPSIRMGPVESKVEKEADTLLDVAKRNKNKLMIGTAALGAIAMGMTGDEEERRGAAARKTTAQVNKSSMGIFKNSGVHHGSGFADWDNAVQHGQYG